MSTDTVKPAKGKRYSDEEKQEVVDFVLSHNASNGRGGQTAAAEKYGVSQLTISSWLKKTGAKSDRKKSTKSTKEPKSASAKSTTGKRMGRPPGKKNAAKVAASVASSTSQSGGSISSKLKELMSLGQQIDQQEAQLSKLRNQFDSLKGSL